MDPIIFTALQHETERSTSHLELIPSENNVSPDVLAALGSIATQKYAEGYPGKRYYGGCEYMDVIEQTAIDRAKALFGADHVNVQPLSGAPANLAAYSALLNPGDTILGMDLSHGGHLTHGHPLTLPAKLYRFIPYHTTPAGEIDYEEMERLAQEHRPKLILVGFSSFSGSIDYARVHEITQSVGALTMADIAHIAGLIAGKALPSPVPLFDVVTTTTHKTLRGPRGGMILCKAEHAKAIDKAVFPGLQGGPHMNVIAAKAVAFHEALQPSFEVYAKRVLENSAALAHALQALGHTLVFGGTKNHLMLIDVTALGLTGKEAETALSFAGITVNKNVIPNDPRGALNPSGIRLGTPTLTTRGLTPDLMPMIATWINTALRNATNPTTLSELHTTVVTTMNRYPLFHTEWK